MNVTFYDVKKRANVEVPVASCWKTKYERQAKDGGTQVRYAVKANHEGSSLTKFVSKDTWDSMDCPEK